MKVVVITQARMSSRRLPGKVLMPLNGKPMIQYLIERVHCCSNIDRSLVATSIEVDDDPVESHCQTVGQEVFRGSLNNVTARFIDAADSVGCDTIVRLSGDSPFLDQVIIDRSVREFESQDADIVTNVKPRTYPPGCSVEVFRVDLLRQYIDEMPGPELEHVTRFLYTLDHLSIANFENDVDLSGYRLTVDDQVEFERAEKIAAAMSRPHTEYTIAEVVELGLAIGA